jgi:hypothetical protein
MVAKRIREFEDCILKPYDIKARLDVRDMILGSEIWEENDLFRISKLKETKVSESDTAASKFDSKTFAKISKSMLSGRENVSAEKKLTHRDWQLLLSVASVITCHKDQVIITEGTSSSYLYRAKKGKLRVARKDVVLATIEPMQMFGEMSILGAYGAARYRQTDYIGDSIATL